MSDFLKLFDNTTVRGRLFNLINDLSPEQQSAAQTSLENAQQKNSKPIVTEISPAKTFWRAEEYHQQYLEKRGQSSCHL